MFFSGILASCPQSSCPQARGAATATATTATTAAAEEFPNISNPHPITHRDGISRSGNHPSLRLEYGMRQIAPLSGLGSQYCNLCCYLYTFCPYGGCVLKILCCHRVEVCVVFSMHFERAR